MILVDTSIWVDHFRKVEPELSALLKENRICMHPFILGEVALGHLKNRARIMDALGGLPQVSVANDDEAMGFINQHKLYGIGVGYVDIHLLAAVRLAGNCKIWTRDKRLHAAAIKLRLAASIKN